MLYDFSKIKFWLYSAMVAAIFIEIASLVTFGHSSFLGLFNKRDYFLFLNLIGAYTGIAALTCLLMYKPLYFSSKQLLAITYIAFFFFLSVLLFDRPLVFSAIAANLVALLAFFSFAFLSKTIYGLYKSDNKPIYQQIFKDFLSFSTLNITLGWATSGLLELNQFLLPNTIDYDVYRIDAAFHGFATQCVLLFEHSFPLLQTFVLSTYGMLSISLFFAVLLVILDNRMNSLNIWRTLSVPFGLAFILYSLMPMSGPIYAFPNNIFPYNMPNILDVAASARAIPPASRNGMPSMHLTGALLVFFILAAIRPKIYFYLSIILVVTTFFATLALGEHYLLDLIVALPFAASLAVLLINPQYFLKRVKPYILSLNIAIFFMWVGFLMHGDMRFWLSEHHVVVRLLSLITVLSAVSLGYQYLSVFWHNDLEDKKYSLNELKIVQEKNRLIRADTLKFRWVIVAFFTSGFAGLFYEVVYAKGLGVTFGGTSLAAYTVLTTYMGGMAIGSWIGGILADKSKNPLKLYALLEGMIGLYALLTPMIFSFIQTIYVGFAGNIAPDATVLTFARVLLGVLSIGFPTILMGATLPVMFSYLKHHVQQSSDSVIAILYMANVGGAALGALLSGYLIIPTLGIRSSIFLAALISLLISLYAIDKWKQSLANGESNDEKLPKTAQADAANQECVEKATVPTAIGFTALVVVTIGGFVTLALEIVNMHLLSVVAGNSVYAFSLMLVAFLFGLSIGSVLYQKAILYFSREKIIMVAQLGVFFTIMLSGVFWDRLVDYFASFAYMQQFFEYGFGIRELIRAIVCMIVMVPPAIFVGLSYPAALGLSSDWLVKNSDKAKGVGIASFLNTFGNIMGVLVAGFVLLNIIGSNNTLLLLAIISLLLSVLICVVMIKHRKIINTKFTLISMSIISIFAFYIYPNDWNYQKLSTGANVYFYPVEWGNVIDHVESIQGGITSVTKSDNSNNLTLLTNGKFQGNNTGEVEAQKAFALIPMLHVSNRDDALVIGYGTGNSARVFHDKNFKHMDIIEISKDVANIADKYFSDINKSVSKANNVNLYYTDGRNFLLTQDKKYDLISMEITSIWFAGAANLYNQEFYQLADKRLKKDGVLQQWLQLHHIHKMDLLYIINTVHSVFKYVWVYESGGQGIIVASNSKSAMTLPLPDDIKIDNLDEKLLLSPKDVDNLSSKIPNSKFMVSNDNNLYLEYSTPKGNAIQQDVRLDNIDFLKTFRVADTKK